MRPVHSLKIAIALIYLVGRVCIQLTYMFSEEEKRLTFYHCLPQKQMMASQVMQAYERQKPVMATNIESKTSATYRNHKPFKTKTTKVFHVAEFIYYGSYIDPPKLSCA